MPGYKDGGNQNMLLWRHKGTSVKILYIENDIYQIELMYSLSWPEDKHFWKVLGVLPLLTTIGNSQPPKSTDPIYLPKDRDDNTKFGGLVVTFIHKTFFISNLGILSRTRGA